MTHRVAALVAALVVGVPDAPPAQTPVQACGAASLLIRDVDVWTPNGLLPGRDVLIRDGRIATVGATGTVAAAGVEILDGDGAAGQKDIGVGGGEVGGGDDAGAARGAPDFDEMALA